MTDTIKKGTVLWAIDPCVCGAFESLTIGKDYPVTHKERDEIVIVDDQGYDHWFDLIEDNPSYYGKYFSPTPPEPKRGGIFGPLHTCGKYQPKEDKGVQTEGRSEEQEITRLRAENDRLRREIETLKAKW